MDLTLIIYLLTLITISELRSPQVYEEVDETPAVTIAEDKEPNKNQRFSFADTTQQDRQKWRYLQQQAVDARNQERNRAVRSKKFTRKSPSLRKRDISRSEQNEVFQTPISINHALSSFGDTQIFEDNAHGSRDHLQMLNSLVGQSPLVQLHGLRDLLNTKDHTPIMEDIMDIANPLNRPNVKVEPAPPELQEAVANALVLQADTQRKIKGHDQASVGEIENQLHFSGYQEKELTSEIQQPQRLPTYGKVLVIRRKPSDNSHNIYGDNNLQYASKYAFGYKVRDFHSGNDFGHEEIHDGKTVKGRYHVVLPDGRLQNVQYWADDTGYHAKVTYDTVAIHPVH